MAKPRERTMRVLSSEPEAGELMPPTAARPPDDEDEPDDVDIDEG